MIISSAVKLTH